MNLNFKPKKEIQRILIYSAERLNYFIGQQDGEGGILEQIGEDRPTDFAIKTHKDQIRRVLFLSCFENYVFLIR